MKDMEKEISNTASVDAMAPIEGIKELIFTVRGVQVMLERDLARLYQVQTKVLNQAVKRNINRFPERFMFQLTENESETLLCSRSQIVTLNEDEKMKRGQNLKYLPYVFTEQDVTQLSAVLRSDVAVEMSIRINDAFHAMRHLYLLGASVKDMGKGLCAIAPVGFSPEMVLKSLKGNGCDIGVQGWEV